MVVSGDPEQVRAYPVSGRGLRAWRVMKARWQCTCPATARRASCGVRRVGVSVENGYYGSVRAEAMMAEAVWFLLVPSGSFWFLLVPSGSMWLATSAWSGDGWRQ